MQLALRVLELDPNQPGIVWSSQEVCTKHFIGFCTAHEIQREYHDLKSVDEWKTFVDMDFVFQAREKP